MPEAFATLSLTGKTVTAADVSPTPQRATAQESLDALVGALQQG